MKKPLLLLSLLFVTFLNLAAKNYYVAANGNNANSGLSETAPWQTISKVNSAFASMAAGDNILFRRGDTFFGALVIGRSGASGTPMVIGAYGTGAKPIITGFVTVSSWTSVSTGIYQAYVPGAKSTLNLVTMNDVPKALGRYPNITDANGGYLSYESFSATTSITDNQLTSTTNWTGAEVAVRKKLWVIDRCKITAHSGTKLTFTNTNGSTYEGTNGYGYFIQNDARTLDQLGEWYFNNSTKYLQIYFGTVSPSSYKIKVSTIDTLVRMASRSYITIDNLVFEGANGNAVYAATGSNFNVTNCDFVNAGVGAIYVSNISSVLIDNCTTNNILSNAIVVMNSSSSGATIRNCAIKNTAIIPGMGLSSGHSYKGILANAKTNLLIEYNKIDTTGYAGIDWQGSDVIIRYNVVNYFDFVKDDAGGIYTFASGTDAAPGPSYTNRVVNNNIVMNGIGAPNGKSSPSLSVSAIYCDGRTMNVSILNNSVFNNARNGIHCTNPNNVTIKGNTSYNNFQAMSVMRWAWGAVTNLSIKNNTFYPKTDAQKCFHYTNAGLNEPATNTVQNAVSSLGNIDSNTYSMLNQAGFDAEVYGTTGGALIPVSPFSLEGWRSYANHDINSKKPAKLPDNYKLTGLVGNNKFTNGLFSTTISGLNIYGTSTVASWDNTNKISGGSMKIIFSAPMAMKYMSFNSSIGAVSSSKKYLFRFSTYGTTQQGILKAYIRQTASPYTSLVPIQVKSFGVGRKDHEFLFNAPTTNSNASFVVEIEQNSGTTYVDNVEFYEANATVYDLESQLRFEYNATKIARTVSLDGKYIGVDGTKYNNGSVTLEPFTSLILVKDTGTVVPPPQPTSLKSAVAAPAVNCYGGNTTVTVSATGGRTPYTGTGSFTANAGNGSLKVSFTRSVPASYTHLYYTIGAISSSRNYVLRFTTLGTTSAGKLRAAIRLTSSPSTTITARQTATYGTTRKDHQFIFTAPPSQSAASFQIEIDQSSGITYFDNIAFFEADADGTLRGPNLYADGQFEGTTSRLFTYSFNNNHTIAWDHTSKITSTYYYPVKDADNSTSVASITVAQPSAALNITVTAGIISVLGGRAPVTVSATGGTSPYTGTGSFSVLAGTFTYTVTDAKGCTSSKTITVLPFSLGRPAAAENSTAARSAAPEIVSIMDNKEFKINAYPNPAATSFNLQVEGSNAEKITLMVYNFDGKIIYQTNGSANSKYTFGNNFAQGVYTLKVIQGKNIKTLKIVKLSN